ncbi:MAG TPA: FtsX-like permease family protein [Steroidobacteraceae bacterium]|jgi:putative ABC transport system permease protein|nr:FtsX-like permease family protein [Steroidobacteraceae bacterium]
MMEFVPILAAWQRHKLIVVLLALLVALTCGIVCNVALMIQQRGALMSLPSGVAESNLVLVQSIDLSLTANPIAQHKTDLAALGLIPGVKAAAAVDALPFNGNNWTNGIMTTPDGRGGMSASASALNGTPGELRTLGIHIVAGRNFHPDEYIPLDSAHGFDGLEHVSAAIITEALAERLFPGKSALGRTIYSYPNPMRIVGIVDHLLRPDIGTGNDNDYSAIFPMLPDTRDVTYVLRTSPQERERVLKQAKDVLYQLDENRVLRGAETFEQLRARYFESDRTMIGLLIASAAGLLFVAALGITGLANFWVIQRRTQIGIRRALGATRGDILRYFQSENFLIVSFGIALGVVLAFAINTLLMRFYELRRLPFFYLPIGAVLLWCLGQIAVLGPALRASHVPPVAATRSG